MTARYEIADILFSQGIESIIFNNLHRIIIHSPSLTARIVSIPRVDFVVSLSLESGLSIDDHLRLAKFDLETTPLPMKSTKVCFQGS